VPGHEAVVPRQNARLSATLATLLIEIANPESKHPADLSEHFR
jgi:hypothetical protein